MCTFYGLSSGACSYARVLRVVPQCTASVVFVGFGLQVGRLLQQLAMTGSEEGDPRTKSSLGKFDKVSLDPVSWEAHLQLIECSYRVSSFSEECTCVPCNLLQHWIRF